MAMNRFKKLKKGPIITLSILVFVLALSGFALLTVNFNTDSNRDASLLDDDNNEIKPFPPKTSDVTLTHNITIDNINEDINWEWASGEAWCSGTGVWGDPYLIDSQVIYINNTNTAGINISNSHDVYFKILDTEVRNNASGVGNGISLTNCTNGIISGVISSSNGNDGLQLIDCSNITISTTAMNQNERRGLYMTNTNSSSIGTSNMTENSYGIYCDDCVLNTFTSDNASSNTNDGLTFLNCTYNEISSSYFDYNEDDGLFISDSDLNNLTVEADLNGANGLLLVDSDSCLIITGEFINNTGVQIAIIEDDGNSLTNSIYGNTIEGTTEAHDNSSTANTWDNGVDSGNTWASYTGTDDDDDGIGDDPYDIGGTAGATDDYPIFSDGNDNTPPSITIVFPVYGRGYESSPYYTITIIEAIHLNAVWYTLDGGVHNVTITGTLSGYISPTRWDVFSVEENEERAVYITFYASDLAGNIGSATTVVLKTNPDDDDTIYMYALSQNQIFILTGFALALSLALRMIIIRGKRF